MSFDFADKAVEDFHFLFPASVLTFDRFMDKDFFNQRIQKFSRQFCGIDILFHQTYPLFSVNRCLGGGLHRFVKPFNFYVQFSLFALILFGQHIEIVFCNASGRPVLMRNELRKEELMDAVINSSRSYEEILAFVKGEGLTE